MKNNIILRNVNKFYIVNHQKKYVLKNANCVIPGNKNIGILGLNGAGKSTLLRMLGGIESPNSGKIILPAKSFSWPMALSGGFANNLSAYDNTKFIARIYGQTEDKIEKICDDVKLFSELGDAFFDPVVTYSSGMRTKFSFALSISFDFHYYLIDETLSVGDVSFRTKCNLKIKEIQERSHFLIVSHDMSTIRQMSDIVILLHNQNVTVYENVEEAIAVYSGLTPGTKK